MNKIICFFLFSTTTSSTANHLSFPKNCAEFTKNVHISEKRTPPLPPTVANGNNCYRATHNHANEKIYAFPSFRQVHTSTSYPRISLVIFFFIFLKKKGPARVIGSHEIQGTREGTFLTNPLGGELRLYAEKCQRRTMGRERRLHRAGRCARC